MYLAVYYACIEPKGHVGGFTLYGEIVRKAPVDGKWVYVGTACWVLNVVWVFSFEVKGRVGLVVGADGFHYVDFSTGGPGPVFDDCSIWKHPDCGP